MTLKYRYKKVPIKILQKSYKEPLISKFKYVILEL